MKNLATLTFIGILATGSLTAQSFIDKTETTEFSIVKKDSGEPALVKTIKREHHPIIFDEADKTKLNQDIAMTPTYVNKTILVDVDNDAVYEKEAFISYRKEENGIILQEMTSNIEDENIESEFIFVESSIETE